MTDPLTSAGAEALPEAVDALLQATVDSVRYLHSLVNSQTEETRERRQAAQALLGLAGVQNAAQKQGVSGSTPTQVSSLLSLLSGRSDAASAPMPYSPWAERAARALKCGSPTCDWPTHGGGTLACGHTREAGYKDACGLNHSMTVPCGTVGHPRSDWWDNEGTRRRRQNDAPAPSEWTAYRKLGIGLEAS